MSASDVVQLVIVGGGFSGVSLAVQVARYAPRAWQITIVEPDESLGGGLAYSTADPDHRLNGPFTVHCADPNDATDGDAWARRDKLLERDPDALCAGGIYPRRADFARYLADAVRDHARANPSGSAITHRRARVVGVERAPAGLRVALDDGSVLAADKLVLAIGNPPPRLPAPLQPWANHPALFGSPWQAGGLRSIAPDARVTVMGSSLTAADVLATLIRQTHRGPITVFSRRGLRPRPQRSIDAAAPAPEPMPASWLVDRVVGPLPAFVTDALTPEPSLRALIRALRAEIAAGQLRGEPWQQAFDSLRDVVWQVWPQLPTVEQRRFLRHVRPWYDVHRFRMSPPTSTLIDPAVASGQIRFVAARLTDIAAQGADPAALTVTVTDRSGQARRLETDALINCSGLDLMGRPPAGSLPASLLASGMLCPHPSGLGYVVGADNEVIGANNTPVNGLHLIGPPTAGCFGDPLGAAFIAVQIHRMLPALFASQETTRV